MQNYLESEGTSITCQLQTVKQEEAPGYVTNKSGTLVVEILRL